MQRNYTGPFLEGDVLSAINVRFHESRKAAKLVVHTDKLKHLLGDAPAAWAVEDLPDADGEGLTESPTPSDFTHV